MPALPTPTPASLAVVICTYTERRLPQLLAAVESARLQASAPDDEVIVVVDHAEELREHLLGSLPPDVRVLPNTEARGLSGARNTGWRDANADVVAFVDDDASLRKGALEALRTRVAEDGIAAVGGAAHAAWDGGEAPFWFPEEYGWVVGCDYRGLPGNGGDIRNPIGACMAVRRDALEKVGGFSARLGRVGALPVGCEETLMGIRIRQQLRGARIVRDVHFAVDHVVPADRQRISYFLRRCFYEGRSKALLARAAGRTDGLSSERRYVLRVLTSAVMRYAARGLLGRPRALAQAALVILGLGVTTAGLLSVREGAERGGPTRVDAGAVAEAEPTGTRASTRPREAA